MVALVEKFVHSYYPEFNKNCRKSIIGGNYAHMMYYEKDDDGGIETFARYYFNEEELALNRDLFMALEGMFDEHMMTYVIDWFNKEFNQTAETVTY